MMRRLSRHLVVWAVVAGCGHQGTAPVPGAAAPADGGATPVAPDASGSAEAAAPSDASGPPEAGAGTGEPACPIDEESTAGKIHHQAYLQARSDKETVVALWLRPTILPAVPDCPSGADRTQRCPARDAALRARQDLNVRQIDCVLGRLASRVSEVEPVWYEAPYHLTSGRPVPVGLAFALALSWTQIEALARHPFVARVEPPPGEVAATGTPAPASPAECPTGAEAAMPKLDRVASIVGKGIQPVVVEVRDEGVLPGNALCPGRDLCPEQVNALWERTILNRREMTCVRRRIDEILTTPPPKVSFFSLIGAPGAPLLPPFGEASGTLKSFGLGLSWEQASQLARHPYVESLWTQPGIQFETPPAPGCPLDLTAPIPMITCPSGRDSGAGKIPDRDRMQLMRTTAPVEVIILVDGGPAVCPLPTCSAQPCPERDAIIARMTAESLASQRCVREMIAGLGGKADPEASWLTNSFLATLTWDQIQSVATHPHVKRIESRIGPPPP